MPGQEGSNVRLKREVTINMLLGGGEQGAGMGGHKDGGLSPLLIDRVRDADDRPAVLVARRRDGRADAGGASPPSSPPSYHSPSGGLVRPAVRNRFWCVLEIDAAALMSTARNNREGICGTSGEVATTTTDANRRGSLEVEVAIDVGRGREGRRGHYDGQSSDGGG